MAFLCLPLANAKLPFPEWRHQRKCTYPEKAIAQTYGVSYHMVIRNDIVPMVVVKFKVTADSNHNLLLFENLRDQQILAIFVAGPGRLDQRVRFTLVRLPCSDDKLMAVISPAPLTREL